MLIIMTVIGITKGNIFSRFPLALIQDLILLL